MTSTTTQFVIRRRGTLEFFAGFDANSEPVFSGQQQARTFTGLLIACAQASLLNGADRSVQLKPEALV